MDFIPMKKKAKKKGAKKTDPGKKQLPESESSENKTFDFGGLPDRDLKKNLGCG
jgi:hypothetical protein